MSVNRQTQITSTDVDNVTSKLTEFAATLNAREQTLLMGVLELAGKMYEGTGKAPATKRELPLVRETIRELNVWDRLLETQGWSLWGCPRPLVPGEDVENPE